MFRNYITKETQTLADLTSIQKKALVDLYCNTNSVSVVKRKTGITTNLIKTVFNKLKSIEQYVIALMSGTIIETPSTTDEDGNVIPATFKDAITTVTALKSEVAAKFDYPAVVTDYVVDKIIKYSDGSGTNTFTTFKTYFNE